MRGFMYKYYQMNDSPDEYYSKIIYYKNPHYSRFEIMITKLLSWLVYLKIKHESFLDLACGSGEITRQLLKHDIQNVEGLDPYLYDQYVQSTGKLCHNLGFVDIIDEKLNKKYDIVICSYALHLCSEIESTLQGISKITKTLIVISPHSKPQVDGLCGWKRIENFNHAGIKVDIYQHFP